MLPAEVGTDRYRRSCITTLSKEKQPMLFFVLFCFLESVVEPRKLRRRVGSFNSKEISSMISRRSRGRVS